MWGLEVALDHWFRSEAFFAFILKEKQVSRIDAWHDSIISLEPPTYAKRIIGHPWCVPQCLRLDALQISLLIFLGFVVDVSISSCCKDGCCYCKIAKVAQQFRQHYYTLSINYKVIVMRYHHGYNQCSPMIWTRTFSITDFGRKIVEGIAFSCGSSHGFAVFRCEDISSSCQKS